MTGPALVPMDRSVDVQLWRCARCGKRNPFTIERCAICRELAPYALSQARPPAAAVPVGEPFAGVAPQPAPSPASAAPPPSPFAPPGEAVPPWGPPPPIGGPPPPPTWAVPRGVPPAPRGGRKAGPIAAIAVVAVIAVLAISVVVARQTDPHAAADRAALDRALPKPVDLGASFQELDHQTFARSRGGLRVEGDFSGCTAADQLLERNGQAGASTTLVTTTTFAAEAFGVMAVSTSSVATATPLVDVITQRADDCIAGALEAAAKDTALGSVIVRLTPAPAPALGSRAAAFRGTLTTGGGGPAFATVDFVVVQQGRAVVLFLVMDTSSSIDATHESSVLSTILGRLRERFGP